LKVVVDTNVPIVANRRAEHASLQCVLTCIRRLENVMDKGRIVLDNSWLILTEYKNHLSSSGQPGVGDAFLKWALTNRANLERCELIEITPKESDSSDFEEFPADDELHDFDLDDRKFVAVALAHPERPPVLQAVDTEWWAKRGVLERAGVQIDFLCVADMRRLVRDRT